MYDDEDPSSLSQVLHGRSFDACFNLAAYGVLGSQIDADRLRRTNELLGPELIRNLPESCLYVHAGSVSEYGDAEDGHLLVETDQTVPLSPYGESKLRGTLNVLRAAEETGTTAIVLRLFHTYGPGEADSRLTSYLIDMLASHQPADLTSGEQFRDLLFVDDVAAAFVHSLRFLNRPPVDHIFNICSSTAVTIRQVGEMLADILERPQTLLRWGTRPMREGETLWLVGNSDRFRQATGWKPAYSLWEGLTETVNHRLASEKQIPAPHGPVASSASNDTRHHSRAGRHS